MKRLKRKLHSSAGESLAETLAALLVAVIALAILAGMIMSSNKLIRESRTHFDAYYEGDAGLNSMEAAGGTAATVEIMDGEAALRLTDEQTADTIDVYFFKNGKAAAYRIKE